MTIPIHRLIQSYHRSLLAKCQQIEFQSWGGDIVDNSRKTIAEHQELENRYVAEMIERRASETQRSNNN